jgi:hypothetical protein
MERRHPGNLLEMEERHPRMNLEELRKAVRTPAGEVLNPGDPERAVMELRELGVRGASSAALGSALWQIWGRISDEWTQPRGDRESGARWARESALQLLEAVGDRELEREYCERWLNDERLGIIPPG